MNDFRSPLSDRPRSCARPFGITATLAVALALAACSGSNGNGTTTTAPGASAFRDVASVPVSFQVSNVNRSQAICPTDGAAYTITGRLVGPRAMLESGSASAITVYMHSVGWGQYYWHFQEFPAVDYASQMALLGHVSLVYDQLGYGGSGRPPGLSNCYGGEADIVNQMIGALRNGTYTASGTFTAQHFARVALASHGVGALMAEPAAYSFANIDALIVTSWSDFVPAFAPAVLVQFGTFSASCLLGGQQSDGTTGPGGYAFFPLTEPDFETLNFANADPAIVAAARARRGRASCGEPISSPPTVVSDTVQVLLPNVHVPVLLVNGAADRFFMQPVGSFAQALYFSGSPDLSSELIPGAGSALALERSAPAFRTIMNDWLTAHGF